MTSAVITYCGHFFHGNCLRKWLYVQETCPMCHASIKPSSANPTAAAGEAPPPHQNPPPSEQQPSPETRQEEEQGSQGDHVCSAETNCNESERKYSSSERNCSKESLQHLHYGANGDSQGVANPVPSCSSHGDPEVASQELREVDWNISSAREVWITAMATRQKTEQTQRKWDALECTNNRHRNGAKDCRCIIYSEDVLLILCYD